MRLILLLIPALLTAADIPLEPVSKLKLLYCKADSVTYKAVRAVRIAEDGAENQPDGSQLAIIPGTSFEDGIIDVDLAGDTQPGAAPEFKGFTGIAFRVQNDGKSYDAFYLRPRNGRIEDQVMRNHSAQYIAHPEFGWRKLRTDFPWQYESYVDLVPGDWVHVRIEVRGEKARLFVRNMEQPVLIVNDMKHSKSRGALALWIGPKTVAHFANLKIAP